MVGIRRVTHTENEAEQQDRKRRKHHEGGESPRNVIARLVRGPFPVGGRALNLSRSLWLNDSPKRSGSRFTPESRAERFRLRHQDKMKLRQWRSATLWALFILIVISPRVLDAHAHLKRSSPSSDEHVSTSPTQLRLWFSETPQLPLTS